MYSGSFDGTLKVWDVKFATEKSNVLSSGSIKMEQIRKSISNNETKMSIEHEKSVEPSKSSSNYINVLPNNSRVDTDFDESIYYKQTKSIDIIEIV